MRRLLSSFKVLTFDCYGTLIEDYGPKQVDRDRSTEVKLSVSGLTEDTRVELTRGKRTLFLPHEHIRAGGGG